MTAILAMLPLLFGACTGGGSGAPAGSGSVAVRVVATTTVLADLVGNVGGTLVAVDSLVPSGGDVHTFDPTPDDIKQVADADLIVMNGLGLDDWLGDLAADAGAVGSPIVELAPDLEGVTYLEDDDHPGEAANPHLWLNVAYASKYVARITDALTELEPRHAATFQANETAYQERLLHLDAWARDQVAALPAESRRIVSFHEAFPYLADAYGLEIVGVAVEAPGQEPSAADVAALIDAIRRAGVRAVFSEAQFPNDLVERIAAETGATVEAELYSDSLGDPPLDSYEGLIRWDIERIVGALR